MYSWIYYLLVFFITLVKAIYAIRVVGKLKVHYGMR